ncbi:MAG: FAD-linked oxidase C-terminal domain-containing protein [Alphaproteobacteria bacterium]|nr:FAD-linked oxidase C-terminal domain-containing protein [Alphaproteobacteria bacterium]
MQILARMQMPPPDATILARRAAIINGLRGLVPDGVVGDTEALAAYDSDALTAYRQKPLAVVLPKSATQVSDVLRFCSSNHVKIVPRGAGTSLSGGALPVGDGIVLGLSRMNKILEIDLENRCAVVEPGVTNLAITRACEADGFYYAPDPSSQIACTIGGNVAENSGGIHCLKYGLTTNNLMGIEFALIDGTRIRFGGKAHDSGGLDFLGLITGSEGLLGVVTEVTVRLRPKPPAAQALLIAFPTIEQAGACVAGIIAAGIIPAAMEIMDRFAMDAIEAHLAPGYPSAAGAILIAEVDGVDIEVLATAVDIENVALRNGALSCQKSTSDAERDRIWAGRKAAFAAAGRIAPDMLCMDGTIPRRELAAVLKRIGEMSTEFGLPVANVFHAGDGNLHPLIMFDVMKTGDLERAEEFGAAILKLCVDVGGVLTGEHGVGVEKRDLMPLMFEPIDLAVQERVKCAFDPGALLNPGKVFPSLSACVEGGAMHVHGGRLPFPNLPRL